MFYYYIFCNQGRREVGGSICGCDPKHVKKFCKVTCNDPCESDGGFGLGGFGGLGGGCGGGSGIWILILILLFVSSGNQKKGCTNNIINLDNCDEE